MIPLIALLLTQAAALSLTTTYEHGPVPIDSSANLSFTVDLPTRTIALGLIVSAELFEQTWVGIGISEPTSGSMLGADIATAEFLRNSTDQCTFTDRHVPFAAYPLLTSGGGAPPVFPFEDDCQGGWKLVSCLRDVQAGQIVLEVTRSLDAEETQDRAIPPGQNNVIYAYGSSFAYHSGNRASLRLTFYGDGPIGLSEFPLPPDVEDNFTITATNFPVPDKKTTVYVCTSKKIPVKAGQKRMIIAMEPILNATKNEHVHHLTLYLCRGKEYAKMTQNTVECTTGDDLPGPLGNTLAACTTFVYAYAKGNGRLVVPPEAGFVVEEGNNYLVMETHYDNPDLESGAFDNSGVRVYLTDTMREHEAASILLADSTVQLLGDTVQSGFKYQFSCPSECTEKFAEPVNVFGSFLHMHRTGMEIYNNKFDKEGKFLETFNKVNFWSDSFQNFVQINKTLRPGEQLQVSCIYDTRKRPDTVFGLQTQNEMCMDFIGYWPVQRDPVTNEVINICAFLKNEKDTGTLCGDAGLELEVGKNILLVPNPKLNDTRGAPTDFANAPGTCPVPTDEPKNTPQPGDSAPTDPDGGADPTIGPPVEDEVTCFPSRAMVITRRGKKRMDELQVGDEVLIASGRYSPVFMFTHKDADTKHIFVTLTTEDGDIRLTRGHYLYVNGGTTRAEDVRVGDSLRTLDGVEAVVTKVAVVWETGLFNPQTLHGDVVVDGFVATCYTVRVEPWRAHAFLAPVRWAFRLFGIDATRIVVS